MTRGDQDRRAAGLEASALLFCIVFPPVAAWLYFVAFVDAATIHVLYPACKVIQFAFPVIWVLLVERRSRPRLVPPGRGLTAGFLWGAGIGASIWGFYLGVLRGSDLMAVAAPRIIARIEVIGAGTPVRFLLLALFLSILHSFLEEYYWRWFVFGRLRNHLSPRAALVVSSLAFTAHHVIVLHTFVGAGRFPWATPIFSLGVAAAGALWAWLYARTGSLYPPWLSHMLVDLAIMAIGYDLTWGVA